MPVMFSYCLIGSHPTGCLLFVISKVGLNRTTDGGSRGGASRPPVADAGRRASGAVENRDRATQIPPHNQKQKHFERSAFFLEKKKRSECGDSCRVLNSIPIFSTSAFIQPIFLSQKLFDCKKYIQKRINNRLVEQINDQ